MPFVKKGGGGHEDDGGGGFGLGDALDPPACPVCRRELLPWQEACPDDGGTPVPRSQLPPMSDPLLDRLLAEDDGDPDPE